MSRVRVLQGAGYKKESMSKLLTYFKGIKAEWGKITWPDRRQVFVQTIVVIFVVLFFTMVTFGLDILFKGLIQIFCDALKHIGLMQ